MHFNTDMEIFLVKGVIVCKAVVAAFGSVQKFEIATDAINTNLGTRFQAKGRAVQEKSNKLAENFKSKVDRDRKRSGGDIGRSR